MARLVTFTGAGLSADSGLSTFRTGGGLWEGEDPMVVANALTWRQNRDRVMRFYDERRVQAAAARPNAAHAMMAAWQRDLGAVLLTQNVDDLLERAGCTSVTHLHGRLNSVTCAACGRAWDVAPVAWPAGGRCACGSLRGVRPGVVFFGDPAPEYRTMDRAFAELGEGDVLVVLGTTGKVIDVGSFAARTLATTVLSNLDSGDDDWMPGRPGVADRQFDHVIHGRAAEVAPALDALVRELLARSGDGTGPQAARAKPGSARAASNWRRTRGVASRT